MFTAAGSGSIAPRCTVISLPQPWVPKQQRTELLSGKATQSDTLDLAVYATASKQELQNQKNGMLSLGLIVMGSPFQSRIVLSTVSAACSG